MRTGSRLAAKPPLTSCAMIGKLLQVLTRRGSASCAANQV